MKIKNICKFCKKNGFVLFVDEENHEQWLGDAAGMYLVQGLPLLNEESICVMFDITEKQKKSLQIHIQEKPAGINFNDTDNNETLCEKLPISIFTDRMLSPYKTQTGICFIDEEYMKPLIDVWDEIEIYQRMTEDLRPYFVAKVGFLVYAILMPYKIEKDFAMRLEEIASLCNIELKNTPEERK